MSKFLRLAAAFAVLFCIAAAPAHAEDGLWRRAETEHFVIYSYGNEAQLREAASNLETFDAVLRTLLPPDPSRPPGKKLDIYLFGDWRTFRMAFGMERDVLGFYTAQPELISAFGTYDVRPGSDLNGREVLFHEYTHHYMMQYFNSAYPSWFIEGFAEYLQTMQFHDDTAQIGFVSELRNGWFSNWLSMEELLGPELRRRRTQVARSVANQRFYAQSWVLTHYLMSDPARREALWNYLDGIATGADPIESFEPIFGVRVRDVTQLLARYTSQPIPVFAVPMPPVDTSTLEITRLPPVADGLLLINAELRMVRSHDDARPILEAIQETATAAPDDPFAQRTLASAQIRAGDFDAGRAILQRLIASDQQDAEAQYLMGLSYVLQADAGDDSAYAQTAAQGRSYLLQAIRLDPQNAPAAYYYALTYKADPRPLPGNALNALLRAHLRAPQVGEIGVTFATELMYAHQFEAAITVLGPIANDPHENVQSRRAAQLLDAATRSESPPVADGDALDGE